MTIKTLPLNTNGHEIAPEGVTTAKVLITELGPSFLMDSFFSCHWCGQYAMYEITDDAVNITNEPCPVSTDGLTTTIRLAVPSGKLVVAADLRPVYDGFNESLASYNSVLGTAQVIEGFAAQGCAFGFVGDNWPDLYQTGEGTYALASPDWDEEADDRATPPGWTRLAGVSGALWAYSLADYDDWKARGGVDGDEETEFAEIPAGVYEFTYHGGEKGFDRHAAGTVIFTDIKRVS